MISGKVFLKFCFIFFNKAIIGLRKLLSCKDRFRLWRTERIIRFPTKNNVFFFSKGWAEEILNRGRKALSFIIS